ncbi:MAG: 30S ribosomal protein S20 [Candidatus Harrisonbacteria bacterium RIFCSPLOWO2_02_FULL_45_10c]|uniref:Small ribosomal subunit protein bS20 n=1 Tax=Candidatus Harrisonbacteria bacterium RIFCSPLOWO2_02_FULL_45_10c TaxID=1798410 RepID=A0A1G1ZQQ5_9BACT|nr:MAG: 30S ribosomal protein S20 [Candidatus Harrisonbacteria bacterium RIFCSPLOWO2_02_FULL_45_10c]
MITDSAKKAYRQSLRRRARNIERKTKLQKTIKGYKALVVAKKMEEAAKALPNLYAIIDKTAKVGIIKENKANRLKSRLTHLLGSKS